MKGPSSLPKAGTPIGVFYPDLLPQLPSMIRFSSSARKTQTHPIKRVHPETGKAALFVSPAYTIGIEDMPDDEAHD
ncbi:MAG: hypothetical protein EBV16_11275 [Betaproteobacteria bacterium]|jgi:alpha-ketoglutarate-dependent taurine dioxygenase|nr:hypothetical protein [Betaproteobacteria bacterium]